MLYDHELDPNENRNVADTEISAKAVEMHQRLLENNLPPTQPE
jgi:hypothetical protein